MLKYPKNSPTSQGVQKIAHPMVTVVATTNGVTLVTTTLIVLMHLQKVLLIATGIEVLIVHDGMRPENFQFDAA